MHIPDSILSPSTSAACAAAMLPVWALAGRRVRQTLQTRQVPLLALGAAFCFTIMLFNIPALGGTTAHPIAGTLLAILLGPWAACIGISVALAIQALFFGDGGLLAYGANCFAMAFVLPFVGYSVYRVLGIGYWVLGQRRKPTEIARNGVSVEHNPPTRNTIPNTRYPTPNTLFAALGAYVGLNAAAAVIAVLLGIQPALFHEPDGRALYFPFGLQITLPAMLATHLLIAGPAEAVVTGLVVAYLRRAGFALYGEAAEDKSAIGAVVLGYVRGQKREPLWIGLLALVALSPLGLLAKGDAWGEWDKAGLAEQIKQVEGREYVPKGVERAESYGYKGIGDLEDYASHEGRNRLGYIGRRTGRHLSQRPLQEAVRPTTRVFGQRSRLVRGAL